MVEIIDASGTDGQDPIKDAGIASQSTLWRFENAPCRLHERLSWFGQ
jgi:hypothetical protein